MRNPSRIGWLLATAIGVSACGMLEPRLPDAAPAIPAAWPLPSTTPGTAAGAASSEPQAAADIGWREFFTDPNLEELIAQALANNRDLRVAVLNVEKARAQYRIQRADRVPSIDATGAMYRAGSDGRTTESFSASVGVTNFELDLFGRVRNLSDSALQRYFAQEETRRSAQLSLIAEVANVYLTLAADQEQLRLARATLQTREQSYAITGKRHDLGAASGLDLAQSRTLVEGARADAARYAGQVAQDTNALNLLVGAPVDPQRLPTGFADPVTGLAALPTGLPSEVLLRRPDVLAAEHVLRATNANIGAARAAFFPSISLTGSVGSVSPELSGLFDGGTQVWGFTPQVKIPIFEGGRLRANLTGVAGRPRHRARAIRKIDPAGVPRSRGRAGAHVNARGATHGVAGAGRCGAPGRGTDSGPVCGRPRQLPAAAGVAAHPLRRRASVDRDAARRAVESRGAVQGARRRLAGRNAMNTPGVPVSTARADAQRDRILCAALKCFIEHGFHAASMANIADTAQMSAGLMYRYFDNKNAIVLGIIEHQLEERRAVIRQLHSSNDIAAGLLAAFDRWCAADPDLMNPALFLEMSAEATRSPPLAEALRSFDAGMRMELQAWLGRERALGGMGLPPECAATRALTLQCFIDGLVLRSVRDPNVDRDQLRAAVHEQIDQLTA